jgi:glutamine amidotransferase
VTVAIIKYNGGNIVSVENALRRLAAETTVTDDPSAIERAERVIFPGVGAASTAMRSLRASGLDAVIPGLRQPFLGICLGLQLLCRRSDEGGAQGLGVFDVDVRRFPEGNTIPHMGWNAIDFDDSPLFAGIERNAQVYFVHSYCAELGAYTVARSTHGIVFSAALARDNFWGVQFHPEKSADTGARILENFLRLA